MSSMSMLPPMLLHVVELLKESGARGVVHFKILLGMRAVLVGAVPAVPIRIRVR